MMKNMNEWTRKKRKRILATDHWLSIFSLTTARCVMETVGCKISRQPKRKPTWGSMSSGYELERMTMVAFCTECSSLGRPWTVHWAWTSPFDVADSICVTLRFDVNGMSRSFSVRFHVSTRRLAAAEIFAAMIGIVFENGRNCLQFGSGLDWKPGIVKKNCPLRHHCYNKIEKKQSKCSFKTIGWEIKGKNDLASNGKYGK